MSCPRCGGPTGRWSGYLRHLRDEGLFRIFVPRVRCMRCGRTDALLPWVLSPYRWDTVDVIGQALERNAAGQGVRRIAAALGRPETTVREWCRRFGAVAADLARALLAAAVRIGWSSFDLPTAAGSRCLAAAHALGAAWARRHGTICHDRPKRSFSQPHWLASPPSVSRSHRYPTSAWSAVDEERDRLVEAEVRPTVDRSELLVVDRVGRRAAGPAHVDD